MVGYRMHKVLVIVGPTAVGKTSLSIKLAKKLNGEVISGDSMQVYRKLDIGTAKITNDEMDGIPHHLIDILDVNEDYSAAEFVKSANSLIEEITKRNKLPIIVGGTGFYIQALLDGLVLGGEFDSDPAYRDKLHQFSLDNGSKLLWDKLNDIDPKSAYKIPKSNERRIIRALEVYHHTGELFSEQNNKEVTLDSYVIALNTDRQVLYDRINQRVDLMIENGLIDEAKWLWNQSNDDLPALKGIGYREFSGYFDNQKDLNSVVDSIKQDSRHYAKRQLTWFRNKMNVTWYDTISNMDSEKKIEKDVLNWLNK